MKPLREGNTPLLERFDGFFSRGSLEIVDVSSDVIERATELRAKHDFRAPDAVHLATALVVGADVFLTGDRTLKRCPDLDVQLLTGPHIAP